MKAEKSSEDYLRRLMLERQEASQMRPKLKRSHRGGYESLNDDRKFRAYAAVRVRIEENNIFDWRELEIPEVILRGRTLFNERFHFGSETSGTNPKSALR